MLEKFSEEMADFHDTFSNEDASRLLWTLRGRIPPKILQASVAAELSWLRRLFTTTV